MLTKSLLFSNEIEFLKLYEKVIVSNQYVILVNELDGIAFEEILKQKYQIPMHTSNEKAFLSVSSLMINKNLPQRIHEKIDFL